MSTNFRETTIRRAMTTCRHFNGIQNKQCEAGVTYRVDLSMRLPCIPSMTDKRESWKCDLFEVMTQTEAEAEADEWERVYVRNIEARQAAKDHARRLGLGRGHGGVGSLKCPCCDDGHIRYSVASVNGHMHAACTTKDCVRWME